MAPIGMPFLPHGPGAARPPDAVQVRERPAFSPPASLRVCSQVGPGAWRGGAVPAACTRQGEARRRAAAPCM